MRSRLLLLLLALLALGVAPIPTAGAADTHAPKGARLDWLPTDTWVHVIFHVFHTPAIPRNARAIFGLSPARFRTLRNSALTPLTIGARGGRSAAHVRGALWALLVARADRGVRSGAMSRGEARYLLAEQREQLPVYVGRAFRTPEQQVAFLCRVH